MYRLLFGLVVIAAAFAQPGAVSYSTLTDGRNLSGFRAVAVYLDDSGRAMGARFIHQASGFTLDLLEIQSVPQAFVWVTTYPTSNMGEPHTQEHLLVGKGNKGRALGSLDRMWLMTTNAFTEQWRTCYDFGTSAGPEVFYQYFEKYMDALLHPDYTDEEVHREVRNFGVVANPGGQLHLEEKGSVYNEMTSSMDQAGGRLFHAASLTVYGPEHPLSFSSGGLPAALRVIQPSDIRRFHDSHYFLANMGMIASLPKEMTLAAALARFDAALRRLEPARPNLPVMREDQLPAPQPAPAGRIEYVEYPFKNDQQPGSVIMLWPADRQLPPEELTLLDLFLGNLASTPDTNLYKRLVDSQSREYDFGIKGVYATVDSDPGHTVYFMLQDVPVAHMNDADLSRLRATLLDELARVAAWPDGSPQLADFNQRLKGRIQEQRRTLSKFVNSPPGFGLRNTYGAWVAHLYELNRRLGFRKSVTEKDELAALDQLVGGSTNIWRERLARWKVAGVSPYIEAAKPNPALAAQEAHEREERAAAEVARLKEKYGAPDDQAAIRRYQQEYDSASAILDKAAAGGARPSFVDTPPLTLDDQLDFQSVPLAGGVPLVRSTFDSMTGATAGLALRLDGIPEDRLVFVSLLPALLTRVGVIENGKPVSYEQMTQRLRTEILSLNASFSNNEATGRMELALRGSGNDPAESKRALDWMKLALLHPDWRPENLSRIRDLVDQSLGQLRTTMQGAEEGWVQPVATSYRMQANPLWLASNSFMTRVHNAHRLRWMLKDGGDEAVYAFLADLGKAAGTRAERTALASSVRDGKHAGMEKLTPAERALLQDAAKDLLAALADIPDSSLAADWSYLCAEMSRDLRAGPSAALAALEEIRRSLLVTGGARMFLISSSATRQTLDLGIQDLAASLTPGPAKKAAYGAARRIDARLAAREPAGAHPVFAGLLNPNSQGGVFLNSAAFVSFHDTSRDKLLDYTAANLYGGGGAHSIFSKTIAAGLAYSNGIGAGLAAGRLSYYAERTPELPQTLQFVIGELRNAKPDPALVDYAVAGAFGATRSASSYESRGEDMAADLADGITPEIVSRFRRAILDLRKSSDLTGELFRRMLPAYSRVLPGLSGKSDAVPGGAYFVIGPEKQFAAYEEYLKKAEGPSARLWRLYPRDFWLPAAL